MKLLILLLLPFTAICQDLSGILTVDRLYIETEKRVITNRSYYLNDQTSGTYDLNLGLDVDIGENVYYDKKVTSLIDTTQFRFVALEFELGTNIIPGLDVYLQHFSGHALYNSFDKDFPQDNKVGIRWNLIRND